MLFYRIGFREKAISSIYLTPEYNKREFGNFSAIENDIISKKTIITYNQEMQGENVTVIPAWKYFWEGK